MPVKSKPLHIGVLLDDDAKLRAALSHADNIDYMIEPRDADQLFDYLAKLARDGHQVRTLLLTGHGRKKVHKIGKLDPRDLDIDWVSRRREASYGNRLDAIKQIAKVTARRDRSKDAEQRRLLNEDLVDLKDALKTASAEYDQTTQRERAFEEIQGLMAPGAMVGLLNCYADSDPAGRRFIENIGKTLLARHGGRVVANTDLIVIAQIQPLLAWMTGQPDHLVFPVGDWTTVTQGGSGVSGPRCGAPCNDFKRYGFCDHRAAKDGGPCFQHQ